MRKFGELLPLFLHLPPHSQEMEIDIVTKLRAQCLAAGTNLTKVCREKGVNRQTVEKWKKGTPKSIQNLLKIQEGIKEAKQANA